MALTRRAALAAPLALPACGAVPPLAASPVPLSFLAHMAANLRRADDMATRIGAPLDTAPSWRWIAERIADATGDLDPLDRADFLADLDGLGHEDRTALRRELCRVPAAGGVE